MSVLRLGRPIPEFIERRVSRGRSRGHPARADGRTTLLTVDFRNLTPHAIRLAGSFRRNVDQDGRVIVVQNGHRANNKRLRAADLDVRGFGRNLGHGAALDWGMRSVRSQYVLIADPDSFILSPQFASEVGERLDKFGVAGVRIGPSQTHAYYHPVCLAFETRLWKQGGWSFRPDYDSEEQPNDVGWELTRLLGGIKPDALIPVTRHGFAGAVFGDVFTAAWGTSRIWEFPGETIDGKLSTLTLGYQERWAAWVDRVSAGEDTIEGFPVE